MDAHEGALPAVAAVRVVAKSTVGVEPSGEAERAMAAKFEALVPWAQGVAECEVERLP